MSDLYKIVIIGDSGVGKTNLMMRYTQNEFTHDSPSTIGVEFMTKVAQLNGRDVKLQIWDTAGQERFRAITRSIYHGAKAIICVYDITSQQSFDKLSGWIEETKVHVAPNTQFMVVGNKLDLDHQRVVKTAIGERFAKENGYYFMETSAAENTNVEKIFTSLAMLIIDNLTPTQNDTRKLQNQPNPITVRPSPVQNQPVKSSNEGKCAC